jgi:hypothetical protein
MAICALLRKNEAKYGIERDATEKIPVIRSDHMHANEINFKRSCGEFIEANIDLLDKEMIVDGAEIILPRKSMLFRIGISDTGTSIKDIGTIRIEDR